MVARCRWQQLPDRCRTALASTTEGTFTLTTVAGTGRPISAPTLPMVPQGRYTPDGAGHACGGS
jgi:hypothetical protein